MKKNAIVIPGLIAILIVVVMASGCTNSSNNTTTNTPSNTTITNDTTSTSANGQTYTGQGITFNYPETWTVDANGKIKTPDGIGSVDKVGSIKELASEPPAIPATLDALAEEFHSGMIDTYDKKSIIIAGLHGIEYTPTSNSGSGQRIDVYFAKGDTLYNVFVTTNNLNADKSGFEMIINTIKIQ